MFLSKRNGIYYVFYNNSRGKRTCILTKYKLKSDAFKLPTGIYFYKLQAGDPSTSSGRSIVETMKMVLLR